MQPPFAARGPLEVLHRVRQINFLLRDTRFSQHLRKQTTCRTHKWLACDVFRVARLLADKYQRRGSGPDTKNGLGGVGI